MPSRVTFGAAFRAKKSTELPPELRDGNFVVVDKEVPLVSAATLFINPCTAYLMLR